MATLFIRADGKLEAVRLEWDKTQPLPPASSYARTLEFDESVNATLLNHLKNSWHDIVFAADNRYTVNGGVPTSLATESSDYANRFGVKRQAATAVAANDTYLAIANPTNAQLIAQVRRLTQNQNAIIKRLAQID